MIFSAIRFISFAIVSFVRFVQAQNMESHIHESLPIKDLQDIDTLTWQFCHPDSIDDYTNILRYGDLALSTASKILSFIVVRINDICHYRQSHYLTRNELAAGYQNTAQKYLACMQDVMEKTGLGNLQREHLCEIGHDFVLDDSNRRTIKSLIGKLQGILDGSYSSHEVKRRKTNSPSEDGQILKQEGTLDFLSFGFPNELSCKIFNSLSTRDLAVASRTSTQWYTYILTYSDFLTRARFVDAVGIPDMEKYIEACRKNSATTVTSMTLPKLLRKEAASVLTQISQAALQVRDLTVDVYEGSVWGSSPPVSSLSYLRSLTIHVKAKYMDYVNGVLRRTSYLRSLKLFLEFSSLGHDEVVSGVQVNNLERVCIQMGDARYGEGTGFERFIHDSKLTCINWLELGNASIGSEDLTRFLSIARPRKLSLLAVSDVYVQDLSKTLDDLGIILTYLDLEGVYQVFSWGNEPVNLSVFSKLEYLGLQAEDFYLSVDDVLRILEATDGSLKTVKLLAHDMNQTEMPFSKVFQKCPLLEYLDIKNSFSTNDVHVDLGDALRYSPNLKTLRLKHFDAHQMMKIISPEEGFKKRALDLTIDIVVYKEKEVMEAIHYLQNSRCCSRIRLMHLVYDLEDQEEVVKVMHVV